MKIDYILIYILFVIFLYIEGKFIYRNKQNKNILPLISIILFYSLIESIRYGRGVDYWGYRITYKVGISTGQYFFDITNSLFRFLNLTFNDSLFAFALCYMLSIVLIVNKYKYWFPYLLPLFFIFTVIESECFIRQFFAMSFANFAFLNLIKTNKINKILFVLFAIIAFFIHSSTIFFILIILILNFIKYPINYKYSISLYILFALFIDIAQTNILPFLLSSIDIGDNKFSSYISLSERWFGKEAINDIYNQKWYMQSLNIIFDISLFFSGYKLIKENHFSHRTTLIYNLFVIGAILYRAFFNIELIRRIAFMEYLWVFVIASCFLYFFHKRKNNIIDVITIIIVLLYTIAIFSKFLTETHFNNFIWDAYGNT